MTEPTTKEILLATIATNSHEQAAEHLREKYPQMTAEAVRERLERLRGGIDASDGNRQNTNV